MSSYISGFRTLRLELGHLVSDESALWGFVSGLNIDLRREVLRSNLTTLEDAYLAAERADACKKFVRYGVKQGKMTKKNNDIVPMDIDTMRNTKPRTQPRAQPRKQQVRDRQECYYCGKHGHWVKDCW